MRTSADTQAADLAAAPAARPRAGWQAGGGSFSAGPRAAAVLALQRGAGNRAVSRMLAERSGSPRRASPVAARPPDADASADPLAPRRPRHLARRTAGRQVLARQATGANVCSDPTYCTPYATAAEAASEEAWLRAWALPALHTKFGTEVHDLWESYLSRRPGDSLTPRVFDTPGNPVVESFATSWATLDDVDAALDTVMSRLHRWPGGRLSPHTWTMVALSNFLSSSEMDNRSINYSNPLSIAGNIAGGIGASDAGPDYRKILYGNVTAIKTPLIGNSGYIDFELTARYEVGDAVDFCPGQCGSPAEQRLTIPMSRLEASGEAYDQPFVVRFRPETRSNREFYSDLPL